MIDLDALKTVLGWTALALLVMACVWGVLEAHDARHHTDAPDIVADPDSAVIDSVAAILAPDARDPHVVYPLARVIVDEARAKRLDPVLVAGVVRVENPWLLDDTVSYAGAVGIMQIMPFHADGYGCLGPLDDAGTSVCLGTAILADYLERALRTSLLAYNGCRPDNRRCQRYPDHVTEGL